MYRNILVPLDGTKRSEAILGYVEDLARRFKANVCLLRVEDPPVMLGWDEVIDMDAYLQQWQKRRKRIESYLVDIQEKLREKGINVQFNIEYGSVLQSILAKADEINADLIALASHGLDGSLRAMNCGTAVGLMREASKPLLFIRNGFDEEKETLNA